MDGWMILNTMTQNSEWTERFVGKHTNDAIACKYDITTSASQNEKQI